MKSRIACLYDYNNIELNQYKVNFAVDEKKIDVEMNRLINSKIEWVDGEIANKDDIIICRLNSDIKKYNKDNIKICIGKGLFNLYLEQEVIGMHEGDMKTVVIDKNNVIVTINKIVKRVVPHITDEMVQELKIDGVHTVEEYRGHLIKLQKKESIENAAYAATQYVMQQVREKSDFILKKQDWNKIINIELERCSYIARQEGLDIRKMTEKQFQGKIPVRSYEELVCLTQSNAWESLNDYLVGKYYADKEGFSVSEKEYAETCNITDDESAKSNLFEDYKIKKYQGYYFKKIKKYVEEYLWKEVG